MKKFQDKTLSRIAVISAIVSLAMSSSTLSASADSGAPRPNPLASDDRQSVSSYLSEYGASEQQISKIISNLEKGILPDAAKGGSPSATKEVKANGVTQTISTYPDGSMSVIEVSDPSAKTNGNLGTRSASVTSCKKVAAHTYQNCYAQAKTPVITWSFRFNFGPKTITKHWNGAYASRGAVVSNPHFVWMSSTVEKYGGQLTYGGVYSGSSYLKVGVTPDHATASLVSA
ncbi:hypothetical protein [Acidipropionibacterium virtanenii]|uniref:Uncharacterized protein n=1 Tax=Acidipropionibacterium virtanenii TaxID=2057246 RepID=A0A344UQC5_9ACTN|nr:hypothetical protein [Acidipropionibacterium virtanenii]AXE37473.1 hypothetical protein JS278_00276 [Acidipropionibacterium virtanenii]